MTRAQVREIDRRAIEEFGIPGIVLMENAGRGTAEFIMRTLRPAGPIGIVCGGGNNGGDGFVIARHLANAGLEIVLFLACDPARLKGDAAVNYGIVEKMKLRSYPFDSPEQVHAASPALHQSDVIVDAILGTGFSGSVRPPTNLAIEAINNAPRATIVAVDVPSGLDCDTGTPATPTVRAHHTVTFVARKIGFDSPGAKAYTGRVIVADIGASATLV
ncbi:MAG TPA: NAD(P)H-hydrate epimerase [Phycisphaerae bacterium]|nr:NAD(P)H-hydrate epimerase [Phycisphaerae bacterium]